MYRFFESIAIINGQVRNLEYHQDRVNRTFAKFYKASNLLVLKDAINDSILNKEGRFKCKVLYNNFKHNLYFEKYSSKVFKNHYLVDIGRVEYNFKYVNRNYLLRNCNNDLNSHALFFKKNLLTDGEFANIILNNGISWITPKTALLEGTMRRYLLDQKRIILKDIAIEDLHQYNSFKLINALNSFEEAKEYSISDIIFKL
ncbi:MAG: aminotransferase class IV [Saprospiraceae bacterium]